VQRWASALGEEPISYLLLVLPDGEALGHRAGSRDMSLDPVLQVLEHLRMVQIREEAVVGFRIFPELPIRIAYAAEESSASIRRDHTVSRPVENE
jgi:hypothetical protein